MQHCKCMVDTQNDVDLVEQAKCGDHSAYSELCRRHSVMAKRMIARIVRNNEDVEDVLQEAMLNAYVHLQSFDGRSKFSTWFTRISVNAALMLLRKRRRQPAQAIDEVSMEYGPDFRHFSYKGPSPEAAVLYSQLSAQLGKAIRSLPPKLRVVVMARQVGDLSIEEIAQRCALSVPATKSRLMRARLKLTASMIPARELRDASRHTNQFLTN